MHLVKMHQQRKRRGGRGDGNKEGIRAREKKARAPARRLQLKFKSKLTLRSSAHLKLVIGRCRIFARYFVLSRVPLFFCFFFRRTYFIPRFFFVYLFATAAVRLAPGCVAFPRVRPYRPSRAFLSVRANAEN